MFEALVVGGSYAGISAALQLARARRRILVVDEGQRRNRFAAASHGFLGQDGRSPGDIIADARAQLVSYPNVEWIDGRADKAEKARSGFSVSMADGRAFDARRLILATGVVDELPEVPGLAERWGRSVFHCPFCHGYELNQGEIGVLAVSEASLHHALMLPDWGATTFFLNGSFAPDEDQLARLRGRGVRVERELVERVTGSLDVHLADGRVASLAGLFTMSRTRPASDLAEQLGCEMERSDSFVFIRTDEMKETSLPGVFACGDAAQAFGSVAFAVGDGAKSGVAAYRSLAFGPE